MEINKILFIVTSHRELGNTGKKTGLWIEEFAALYYKFHYLGKEIVIASPKGGQAPIDPRADKLSNTVKLSNVMESDFERSSMPALLLVIGG